MRAFAGQLDRFTLCVLLAGLAIGALWLATLLLGMIIAGIVMILAPIVFVIRHRWLEVGLLLVAMGILPAVGYRLLGAPPRVPYSPTGTIPFENLAPGFAEVLITLGMAVLIVTLVLDLLVGRRRERLAARHDARKQARLENRTTP